MTKNSRWHSCRCFLFNNISEGLFMNKYYVVLRTKEKDELLDVVDALSLEEAMAIAETRYEEQMEVRDGLFVFEVNSPLSFNEKNRFVRNSGGEMKILIRF